MSQPPSAPPDRRRSGRVFLTLPVSVTWLSPLGVRLREEGETVMISQHGVLLKMRANLPLEADISLSRPDAAGKAKGRVVAIGPKRTDNVAYIAVALTVAGDTFFGVTIPEAPASPPGGKMPSTAIAPD